ncbi:DUF3581 family protein [Thiomicrorhabdus sediminis]|uniref:DUF3581 family protein n=1 Tax=Thiomicrorhabdus sediminis TaxID=2580412 RepID=A0A4V1HHV5_9GAMM|nr:DUF3581 family protein [Thiomicrorhabdus sediminis]QCU90343.1 DUF3581 family protein [Thiomicrorhabdus sediminis]
MYLNDFHRIENNNVFITPQQASRFAKEISDDFNPLHNADNKRFCVPGDLLFALVLAKNGLSQKMTFQYTGMVGKEAALRFPDTDESQFTITDTNDKNYLNVERGGENIKELNIIEAFSKAYVAFSGLSFPHILVPLMQQHNAMINPERPMVIYESMAFDLQQLDMTKPELKLNDSQLEVNGKRGQVTMKFDILDQGQLIGTGLKTMVLGGLREYDQDAIDNLIAVYESAKSDYKAA